MNDTAFIPLHKYIISQWTTEDILKMFAFQITAIKLLKIMAAFSRDVTDDVLPTRLYYKYKINRRKYYDGILSH